jgi:hypothetical protein
MKRVNAICLGLVLALPTLTHGQPLDADMMPGGHHGWAWAWDLVPYCAIDMSCSRD